MTGDKLTAREEVEKRVISGRRHDYPSFFLNIFSSYSFVFVCRNSKILLGNIPGV